MGHRFVKRYGNIRNQEYAKPGNPGERAAKVLQAASCPKSVDFEVEKRLYFRPARFNGAGKTTIIKILTTPAQTG